jgi:hypothetical protein
MLKGPPTSIPRQFPTTQAVCLAVCSNGCHQVKKVEDDFGSGIGVYGQGDKCRKGVAGEL